MRRVAIVDDEPMIRTGLGAIINAESDLCMVAEGADGVDVPAIVTTHRPDVILMDVRMPAVNGIEATERLLAANPDGPRILIITTFENDDYVYDALRAGAHGFLLKRATSAEIVHAVHVVATGESVLFPAAIRRLAAARTPGMARAAALLTERESEVLQLVAQGLNNAEIAGRIYLGVETVKSHVSSILAKLGARDRTQAVVFAYESGFVRR